MAKVNVDAGICGFSTTITATSEEMGKVELEFESECPNIQKVSKDSFSINVFNVLSQKPHETEIYKALSEHLPHTTCPLYSAFFKAAEVEAGMALPKDVQIKIEK
jgi:hypothetical protein